MPIRVGNTHKDRNWGSIVLSAAEMATQAATLGRDGFSSAIAAFFKTVEGLRGEDTNEGRAECLLLETISGTCAYLISNDKLYKPTNMEQAEHIIGQSVAEMQSWFVSTEVYLDIASFKAPQTGGIFEKFLECFLREAAFAQLADDMAVQLEAAKSFVECFCRIRTRGSAYYSSLLSALVGPDVTADNLIKCWDRYNQSLIDRFEFGELFGQEGVGAITLSQVYQPLRSVWTEGEIDPETLEEHVAKKQVLPEVVYQYDMLLDATTDWLNTSTTSDRIKLISGGPGSGKSTFAKYLASHLARDDNWRVLLIPLQRLRGTGELRDRVNQYFVREPTEPFDVEYPPLAMIGRDRVPNWLFIFDGLDELAKEGSASETAAQDFATSLSDWKLQIANSSNIKFIVLGRAPSMQQARRRLGLFGRGTFHVLDMLPVKTDNLQRYGQRQQSITYRDPKNVCVDDQRLSFWKKWAIANREDLSVPESMSSNKLVDLTKEPLLAYLLIVSGYATRDWQLAADNRILIYDSLFDGIWNRERTKSTRIVLNDIGKPGFDAMMQTLGLAAWRGSGRTGDENDFNQIRDIFIRPRVLEKLKDSGISKLDNIAVLFYTRKDEEEGHGYEFLHKSFGEYLTARGLFSAFIRWSSQLLDRDSDFEEGEFLRRWIGIAGQASITKEILIFLRNAATLDAGSDSKQAQNVAIYWVEALVKLMDYVIENGIPIPDHRLSWRQVENYQKNAELNLFCLLDSAARVAYPDHAFSRDNRNGGWSAGPIVIPSLIKNPKAFTNFINRLYDASPTDFKYLRGGDIGIGHPLASGLLSRLHFEEVFFEGNQLRCVDLTGSLLLNVTFIGAHCDYGMLKNSKFVFCTMFNGDLINTDIVSSEISNCRFISTRFQNCGFNLSNLERVIFERCDLRTIGWGDSLISQCTFDGNAILKGSFANFGADSIKTDNVNFEVEDARIYILLPQDRR